ncbi:MAG: hypothetical protein ACYDBQ_02605 [Thermoplasmatota archaeon]
MNKTTIALLALAVLALAAPAATADTGASQCQDLAGQGTACASANVAGDCTSSCTVSVGVDAHSP